MRKKLDLVKAVGGEVGNTDAKSITCRVRLFVPVAERVRVAVTKGEGIPFADRLPPLPILLICYAVRASCDGLTLEPLFRYAERLYQHIALLPSPVTLIERFSVEGDGAEHRILRRIYLRLGEGAIIDAAFQRLAAPDVEDAIGERLDSDQAHTPEQSAELAGLILAMAEQPRLSDADTLVVSERIEYAGFHGCSSACWLRVFDPNRGAEEGEARAGKRPLVVIFTELDNNPGTSVTNRIEHLAALAYRRLGSPEQTPIFVEHYPDRGTYCQARNRWQFPEQFDFVEMERDMGGNFRSPAWRRASRTAVEVVVRQRITDLSAG